MKVGDVIRNNAGDFFVVTEYSEASDNDSVGTTRVLPIHEVLDLTEATAAISDYYAELARLKRAERQHIQDQRFLRRLRRAQSRH